MQRWAHVKDGIVTEITELPYELVPGKDVIHPDIAAHMRSVGAEVEVGWIDNGEGLFPAPPKHMSAEEYFAQLDLNVTAHVEAVAKARGYASAAVCVSYAASSVPAWSNDAQAFIDWRDAVWTKVFTDNTAWVNSGSSPFTMASAQDVINALPTIQWPST